MMSDHFNQLTPKLKPCPFCGGKAERIDIDEGENEGGSCICCTKCMASGNVEFEFKENFVDNWNRRVDPLHLLDALEEGRRAIGDHYAPHDCYATGPLTGDSIRDLVQCPACSFIAMYDAIKNGDKP